MIALWCIIVLAAPPAVEPASAAAVDASAAQAAAPVVDEQRAKQLYLAGSEAYRRGRYDAAIEAFEAARQLSSRPLIVFSLGQAYRLQYFVDGDPDTLERAVASYRAYVDAVPDGGRRDHATRHLSTLIPLLSRSDSRGGAAGPARIVVSSPVEGATARVGDGEPNEVPATFEVLPGAHRVLVEAPGFRSTEKEAVAVAGQYMPIEVELVPKPGRLAVRAEPGTVVRVDGTLAGVTPLDGPLELEPGVRRIQLAAAGRETVIQAIELPRDGDAVVEAELSMTGQRIASWSSFAAAIGLGVTAGVFAGIAMNAESDALALAEQHNQSSITREELDTYWEHYTKRDVYVVRAAVTGTAAASATAIGVLLWIFDRPQAPTVTPIVGTTSSGAATWGLGGNW